MANLSPSQETQFYSERNRNPSGRPVGARNRRTREIIEKIIKLGGKDPLERLHELVNQNDDPGIAAMASNILAPYLHSKWQTSPVPRYIETQLNLPPLTDINSAVTCIALIQSAVANNRLDIESGDALIKNINAFIAGKNLQEIELLQHRLSEIEQHLASHPPDPNLHHITGGLPGLPGTQIIGMGLSPPANPALEIDGSATPINGTPLPGPPDDIPNP